jgi:SAM-dependent methyltransferase
MRPWRSPPRIAAMTYILATDERQRERERLDILDAATGPWLERLLAVKPGMRCLDAGAGAGHIARRMAAAGANVVATDIDTTFLDGDFDIRRHDILAGPVEAGAFDLVVARALVVHVRDRGAALAHLAAALKPGGRLLVIDPSLPQTPRVLRASDPALHDRVFAAWNEFLVGAGLRYDAAGAVAALEALGLDADGEGLVQVLRGGEPPARLWALTLAASAGPAAFPAEVARLVAMMDEPGYRAVQLLGYAAWATRT